MLSSAFGGSGAASGQPGEDGSRWAQTSVLVYSEEPADVETVVTLLERWGAQPSVKFDLAAASEALDTRRPQLIVLDLGRYSEQRPGATAFLQAVRSQLLSRSLVAPMVLLGDAQLAAHLDAASPWVHVAPHDDPQRIGEALAGALAEAESPVVATAATAATPAAPALPVAAATATAAAAGPARRRGLVSPLVAAAAAAAAIILVAAAAALPQLQRQLRGQATAETAPSSQSAPAAQGAPATAARSSADSPSPAPPSPAPSASPPAGTPVPAAAFQQATPTTAPAPTTPPTPTTAPAPTLTTAPAPTLTSPPAPTLTIPPAPTFTSQPAPTLPPPPAPTNPPAPTTPPAPTSTLPVSVMPSLGSL